MKVALSSLLVFAALLVGCGSESPNTSAQTPTPSTTAAAPTTEPAVTPSPAPPPVASTPANATPESTSPASPEAIASPATAPASPSGPEPREGVDFTLIDPPAPLSPSEGKIEVAEVFAYYCIHCSTLQTRITPWKAGLPADVQFRYVPMAHGTSEPIARAFYAAEAMGELDRTHDAMFKALAVDRKLKQGTADELADIYAELGVDRETLLSTMSSFAVNAQIARNQKAVTRWAIESTPTVIVNGRYRALVTQDRGHDGLISTIEHLIARERAAAAAGTDPAS